MAYKIPAEALAATAVAIRPLGSVLLAFSGLLLVSVLPVLVVDASGFCSVPLIKSLVESALAGLAGQLKLAV